MSQNLVVRESKFNDAPNCSVAQIREGMCVVFGKPIYTITDPEVDYSNGWVTFYEVEDLHSLDQSNSNPKPKTIHIPLNIAIEIFYCFKDMEKLNVEKIERIFAEQMFDD